MHNPKRIVFSIISALCSAWAMHATGAAHAQIAAGSGADITQWLQLLAGGSGGIIAGVLAYLSKGTLLQNLKPWQKALVEAATEYAQGQSLDSIDITANYSDGNKSALHIDVPAAPPQPNQPTVTPNWKKLVDELEKRFHPKPQPTPAPQPTIPVSQ